MHRDLDTIFDCECQEHMTCDTWFSAPPFSMFAVHMFEPTSIEEMNNAQFRDGFQINRDYRRSESVILLFSDNENRVSCRQVKQGEIVLSQNPKCCAVLMHHYTKLAPHLEGRKTYPAIRKETYWSALAVDFYAIVRQCQNRAKRSSKYWRTSKTATLCNDKTTRICTDQYSLFIFESRLRKLILDDYQQNVFETHRVGIPENLLGFRCGQYICTILDV